MQRTVTVLLAAVVSTALTAQQPAPAFEVASIKRSAPDSEASGFAFQPGGRWMMRRLPVSVLIHQAYPTEARELVGAPEWVESDVYDVTAKASGNPTRDEMRLMMRTLLAQRFKLAVRLEKREQPVWALVVARQDGRTLPGLKRSTIDCDAVSAARREGRTADIPPPVNGIAPCTFNGSWGPDGMILKFGGLPLSWFGQSVGPIDGRAVIDKTGLTGGFEFTITYDPEPTPGDDNRSLFTAVQEQLGLRLASERAPLETLVIDHIERPTPD